MSKHHILKIHPKPLADLLSGAKTCEVRFNDRGFEVGDTVVLREIDPATEAFTGRPDHVRSITHIQQGYGLPDHLCVLSYAQPAAGKPIGKVELFGINMTYVEWRERKMPPLGTELYAAPRAAAPVAAGEPVAWMYDTPRNGRQYHDKRLDHYWWDDFKESYVKGVPLYAAAHGDEAVQYRLLRVGEVIQATDELLLDDCTTWKPMSEGRQLGIGWKWHEGLVPMRRVDAAMRAQGYGGAA